HRRAQAKLAGAMKHADGEARGEIVGQRPGSVRRVVIDDDELAVDAGGVIGIEDGAHEFWKPVALVVGGNDQRERDGRHGAGGQRISTRQHYNSIVSALLFPRMSTRLFLALAGALLV